MPARPARSLRTRVEAAAAVVDELVAAFCVLEEDPDAQDAWQRFERQVRRLTDISSSPGTRERTQGRP